MFLCVLLAVSHGLADSLVSRPAGIIRIAVPPQSLIAAAQPFDPWDASLSAVLFDQLTGSTNATSADHVLFWDAVSQRYCRIWKSQDGQLMEGETPVEPSAYGVSPGKGFYLQNNQSFTQHVCLAGEILLDAEHETLLPPAFSLAGYPYATAIPVSNTALPAVGAERVNVPSSTPCAVPHAPCILVPGQPFWLSVTDAVPVLWTEPCPYETGLFPTNESPPRIADIRVIPNGIAVSITTSGDPKDQYDVFSQDFTTNRFDPNHGWSLAAQDLASTGTLLLWLDTTPLPSRAPMGRCYLAASTIDSDGNGIPDGREIFIHQSMDPSAAGLEGGATGNSDAAGVETGTPSSLSSNAVGTNILINAVQILDGKVIYVDQRAGNDALSGRIPFVSGEHGPKRSIRAGLAAAAAGDTVVVGGGRYAEDLNVAGRDVGVQITGDVDLTGHGGGGAVNTTELPWDDMPVAGAESSTNNPAKE